MKDSNNDVDMTNVEGAITAEKEINGKKNQQFHWISFVSSGLAIGIICTNANCSW